LTVDDKGMVEHLVGYAKRDLVTPMEPSVLSNPDQTGHPIRLIPATQSGRNRPPNPVDSGHPGLRRLRV
jgi:hypothetical protein